MPKTLGSSRSASRGSPRSPARTCEAHHKFHKSSTGPEGTSPDASRGPPQTLYKIIFPEVLPGTCMFLLPHDAFQESSRSAPRTAQDGAHRRNANQHSDVSGPRGPHAAPGGLQRLPRSPVRLWEAPKKSQEATKGPQATPKRRPQARHKNMFPDGIPGT